MTDTELEIAPYLALMVNKEGRIFTSTPAPRS
jgi:hypothetical protein